MIFSPVFLLSKPLLYVHSSFGKYTPGKGLKSFTDDVETIKPDNGKRKKGCLARNSTAEAAARNYKAPTEERDDFSKIHPRESF